MLVVQAVMSLLETNGVQKDVCLLFSLSAYSTSWPFSPAENTIAYLTWECSILGGEYESVIASTCF